MVQEVPDGSNLFVEVRRRFLILEASRELLQHARTSSGGKQRRRAAALHMTGVNRLCGGKRKERQEAAGRAGDVVQVAKYVRRARCIVPLRMQSKKGRRDAPRVGSGQAGVTETKARGGGRGE